MSDSTVLRSIAREIRQVGTDLNEMSIGDATLVFAPAVALAAATTAAGSASATSATLCTALAGQGLIAMIQRNRPRTVADANALVDSYRNTALGYAVGGGLIWLVGTCGPTSDSYCTTRDAVLSAAPLASAVQWLLCAGLKEDVEQRAQATLDLPDDAPVEELYSTLTGNA